VSPTSLIAGPDRQYQYEAQMHYGPLGCLEAVSLQVSGGLLTRTEHHTIF
jgi:hypothetical protein